MLSLHLSKLCWPVDLLERLPVSLFHLIVGKRNLGSDDCLEPNISQLFRTLNESCKVDEIVDLSIKGVYCETGFQSNMLLLFLHFETLLP